MPIDHSPAGGGAAATDLADRPEAEAARRGEDALSAEDAVALEALRRDVFCRGAIPWCGRRALPYPRLPRQRHNC